MSWVITGSQPFPAVIGEAFGGGYFAGYISHTADGNPTHALIVAPRATGATGTGYTLTTNLAWKTANTTTAGTTSPFDGAANTAAMVTAGIADHPAAEFCKNLTIASFTDWYLPARYENEIAYFNLKPTTELNNFSGAEVGTRGLNPYAVPARAATYTTAYPAQTYVTSFNSSAERFEANHWSSTESAATTAWRIAFANGREDNSIGSTKTTAYSVRAFRRIAL
jgi:hypothetical protein